MNIKDILKSIAVSKLSVEDQTYVLTLLEGVPTITEENIGEIITDIVGWLNADDPVKAYAVTLKGKTTEQLAADAEALDNEFVKILNGNLADRKKAKDAFVNFVSLVFVAGINAI